VQELLEALAVAFLAHPTETSHVFGSSALVGRAAGVNAGLSQAFLRIVDLYVPLTARARAPEMTVHRKDGLAVAVSAGIGDAGDELQGLLV
jgi:hypothetical protein